MKLPVHVRTTSRVAITTRYSTRSMPFPQGLHRGSLPLADTCWTDILRDIWDLIDRVVHLSIRY